MIRSRFILRGWTCCCIFTALISFVSVRPGVADNAGKPAQRTDASERLVTIDFNNVDIQVFIKFISELTHKNFIVDQRVKGNVTIISPTRISVAQAYRVFESVLEVHGYTTVAAGNFEKILPVAEARTQNVAMQRAASTRSDSDRMVTHLVFLEHADADQIKTLLAPMVSKTSAISAYAPANALIITEVASNVHRLLRIVEALDVSDHGRRISVIALRNARVREIVDTLNSISPSVASLQNKGPAGREAIFAADERTNTLIVLAGEVDTYRIKTLVRLLDGEPLRGTGKIRVYGLQHADAEETAKILKQLPVQPTTHAKGPAKTDVLSEQVRINADTATNSLIVQAESDEFQVIEGILRKLDIPRSMIYVEALILEVSRGRKLEIGTEWVAAGKGSISGKNAASGGGFVNTPEDSSLPGLSKGQLPGGFSLGVFSQAIEIGGVSYNNLAALFQALKEEEDIRIVSTPQILTADNEEAKLNVGKNIPFQTRTSTSENETFNSFEYRDVGTTLKITPYISRSRTVRLDIGLEVTVLESTTDFRPTTIKRSVDTSVQVQDANTVVIGGQIDDNTAVSEFKVPLLGDIPVLGWLFKFRRESTEKTNLYVFLTPHVIGNPAQADDFYQEKRDQIGWLERDRGEQIEGQAFYIP